MLDDIDIIIEKYKWLDTTPVEEVNFYSTESEKGIIGDINVKDYLIDIGNLRYNFEDSKIEKYANKVYKITSDISMKLSGKINNNYLVNFFEIYNDTTYIKFLFILSPAGSKEVLYRGIINQNAIKESFTIDNNSEIIEVQVLGAEKEFKQYYQNKMLPDNINFPEKIGVPNQWVLDVPIKKIEQIIPEIFSSNFVKFNIENNIKQYYVSKRPCFYYNQQILYNQPHQIGTITYNTSNGWNLLNPYASKNHILFTAEELQNAGFLAGVIKTLQLYLNLSSSNGYTEDIRIRIKHTAENYLTDFSVDSGFTQVYYNSTENWSKGLYWKWFNIDGLTGAGSSPFIWNGIDNIIIELCYRLHAWGGGGGHDNIYTYGEKEITGKWINRRNESNGDYACSWTSGGTDQGMRPVVQLAIGEYEYNVSIFIKSGYNRVTGEENCYNFLEKLSYSMGWYYGFVKDRMTIKNIDSIDMPIKEISYNRFIKYNISKITNKTVFDFILINDGEISCGDGVNPNPGKGNAQAQSGQRFLLISKNDFGFFEKYQLWYRIIRGTSYQRYALFPDYDNFKFIKKTDDADDQIKWHTFEWDYTTAKFTDINTNEASKENMLIFDGGENKRKRFGVNCQNGNEYETESTGPGGDYDMIYNGNYGNMLITLNSQGFLNQTYLDYVKRPEFRNNFQKYFKYAQNVMIEVEIPEIINDPFYRFVITDNNNLNGYWYLTQLEIDYKNKTSTLTLIKSLNE